MITQALLKQNVGNLPTGSFGGTDLILTVFYTFMVLSTSKINLMPIDADSFCLHYAICIGSRHTKNIPGCACIKLFGGSNLFIIIHRDVTTVKSVVSSRPRMKFVVGILRSGDPLLLVEVLRFVFALSPTVDGSNLVISTRGGKLAPVVIGDIYAQVAEFLFGNHVCPMEFYGYVPLLPEFPFINAFSYMPMPLLATGVGFVDVVPTMFVLTNRAVFCTPIVYTKVIPYGYLTSCAFLPHGYLIEFPFYYINRDLADIKTYIDTYFHRFNNLPYGTGVSCALGDMQSKLCVWPLVEFMFRSAADTWQYGNYKIHPYHNQTVGELLLGMCAAGNISTEAGSIAHYYITEKLGIRPLVQFKKNANTGKYVIPRKKVGVSGIRMA